MRCLQDGIKGQQITAEYRLYRFSVAQFGDNLRYEIPCFFHSTLSSKKIVLIAKLLIKLKRRGIRKNSPISFASSCALQNWENVCTQILKIFIQHTSYTESRQISQISLIPNLKRFNRREFQHFEGASSHQSVFARYLIIRGNRIAVRNIPDIR